MEQTTIKTKCTEKREKYRRKFNKCKEKTGGIYEECKDEFKEIINELKGIGKEAFEECKENIEDCRAKCNHVMKELEEFVGLDKRGKTSKMINWIARIVKGFLDPWCWLDEFPFPYTPLIVSGFKISNLALMDIHVDDLTLEFDQTRFIEHEYRAKMKMKDGLSIGIEMEIVYAGKR